MFYYYGAKRRIAARYSPPKHRTIVEPFAGSAAYAMHHLIAGNADQAILVEKDPRVVHTWRRLLAMTPAEVLALTPPSVGERTTDFLWMTPATSAAVGKIAGLKVTSRMPELFASMTRRIARELPLISGKIEVVHGDYQDAPDVTATWFVDAPYQNTGFSGSARSSQPKGMGYARGCDASALDFEALSEWVQQRNGQVIVAEHEGADWLPFRPLVATQDGGGRVKTEVVWESEAESVAALVLELDYARDAA